MLTYRERLRFTWELLWPALLIDLAWALFSFLADFGSSGPESVYHVAAFFLLIPWVVRRAIRHPYPGFRFVVLWDGDDEPHPMTYQESLKVMWLLNWRVAALTLISLAPISFLLGVVLYLPLTEWFKFAAGTKLGNSLGLTALDLITGFAFFPFLIPGMLKKQYRGFRVAMKRPQLKPVKTTAR